MRYLSANAPASQRRRGLVLLVVMGMLTLFSATAIAFVFYADGEGVAANNHLQSLIKTQADIEPEPLAAFFLSQQIYGTDNPYSAMRGWDLARSIYGYNPFVLNFTPYNGVGRASLSPNTVTFNGVAGPAMAVDYFNLVNYTRYESTLAVLIANDPLMNKTRHPEFFGKVGDLNHRYVGGANPPCTSYDTNNLFLAQMTADGTVLMPSYYRPWHSPGAGAASRYMSMRPDPAWHPGFAAGLPDTDAFGDVRNLDVGPGPTGSNNDSRWMDLGYGVVSAPNGKRYKALFAPLIVDLSNRLHLWAHGNRLGAGGTHVSNQVWGPSEVNLTKLPGMTAAEYQALKNLIYGGPSGTALSVPVGVPTTFRPTASYPPYGKIDSNALDTATSQSTPPLFTGFQTTSTNAVPAAAGATMSVSNITSTIPGPVATPGGFPWAIVPGMLLGIDVGTNYEQVSVISVSYNPASPSFTANFTKPHVAGVPVVYATTFPFPTYPSGGWNNANALEMTNNPLALNLFNPMFPNIGPLPLSHQEALLRFGGTNGPALTSEIFRRMPNTFSNTPTGMRAKHMVTLANWHFDRIAAAPYVTYDPALGGKYQFINGTNFPTQVAGAITPPTYNIPGNYPANSDYTIEGAGAGWRSNLGQRLRVNLNRPLADYPAVNAAGIMDLSVAAVFTQYSNAYTDRVRHANDILTALIRATGAQPVGPTLTPGTPDYYATRWLAQLAVNIVDFIDNDDISTAFNWNPAAPGTDGWVFGTELPRLVLSEIYASYDNDPANVDTVAMTSTTAKLNLWAEMHNPLMTQPATSNYPNDGGSALLTINGMLNYKIKAYQWSQELSDNLRDNLTPTNLAKNPTYNVGEPDVASFPPLVGVGPFDWGGTARTQQVLPANGSSGAVANVDYTTATIAPVASMGATWAANTVTITTTTPHGFVVGQTVAIIGAGNIGYNGSYQIAATPTATTFTYVTPSPVLPPSGGGTAWVGGNAATFNKGYYVLGPAGATFLTARDPYLPSNYSNGGMSFQRAATDPPITKVTLLLQRLAVPHLPPNPAPGPTYNPYITVDYVDGVPVNQNRLYDATMLLTPNAVGTFSAYGRKQPHAANASQFAAQTGINVVGSPPPNSFFGLNSPSDTPFKWLTHLDRPLVNQIELRHVSGFKPHELTQQFMTATAFQHRAPWNNQASLLYRALDVLGTPNNMLGTVRGGRWPGNINLNTITEFEIFQALCDAQDSVQPSPAFTSAEVLSVYQKLLTSRNSNVVIPAPGVPLNMALLPTGEGTPFQSFGAGDVKRTWLRPDPTTGAGQLFNVGAAGDHPYRRAALLNKIFNNITPTSNVFAIWWTVGFFEVVDETVKPERLGPELGRSENRHVRHRFFAIVDRSGMQLFNTTSATAVTAWNSSQGYAVGNVVSSNGVNYSCTTANTNVQPPNAAYWTAGASTSMTMNAPAPAVTAGGVAITVLPGMLLEIDTGANAEVVTVTSVAGNTFTANFTMSHAAGVPIICRGNPGPQSNYNPRRDTSVVLHLSVIK